MSITPQNTIDIVQTRMDNVRKALTRDGHSADDIDRSMLFKAVGNLITYHGITDADQVQEFVKGIVHTIQQTTPDDTRG